MEVQLNNPVWFSMSGPQRRFSIVDTRAARYRKGLSPIGGVKDNSAAAWRALADLVEPGEVLYTGQLGRTEVPDCWILEREEPMLQMVLAGPIERRPASADWFELSDADVAEALALADLTQPGPFSSETMKLGRYVGVRDEGELIAMAGERFCLSGYREISSVCTHPDWQGRGLARMLMNEIADGMCARGESPFLHVVRSNTGAIALYRSMGFETRVEMTLRVLRRAR